MKPSELRRTASLKRQKQPLARSKGLKRGRPRAKRQGPILSPSTRVAAFARTKGQCAVPGCKRRAQDPHHLLPQQANKWPELADVLENVIGVCRQHHDEHEHGNLRNRLPDAITATVRTLDLDTKQLAYLAKTYR